MTIKNTSREQKYIGLSTDDKTSITQDGAIIYYTDTKNTQICNGVTWSDYVKSASIVGDLMNNQTSVVILANTNILATNYTSTKYSKSILQVMTNTAGVLSLLVDSVSGTLNNGSALTANAWYEFDISLLSGSTYNLQLSVGATMQIKWQVI
jgi:hypothetical protein